MKKKVLLAGLVVAIFAVCASPQLSYAQMSMNEYERREQIRELIIELKNRLFALQRLLEMKRQGYAVETTEQIGEVDGPSVIPVGESGGWNQSSAMSRTQTAFALKYLVWDWGDGTAPSSGNSHTYKKKGTYTGNVKAIKNGTVLDSATFTVTVVDQPEYDLEITSFNHSKDYELGSKVDVAWEISHSKTYQIGLWVGFILVNEETGEEYFLGDAYDGRSSTGNARVTIPGPGDHSQDGPIPAGEYRLKVYMYGSGDREYPYDLSKVFTVK